MESDGVGAEAPDGITMKKTRKRHEVAFKAKVGLEALKGKLTIAQIAKDYQAHQGRRLGVIFRGIIHWGAL